jgi:hypothetical protein
MRENPLTPEREPFASFYNSRFTMWLAWIAAESRTTALVRMLGIALFVAAFPLPSLRIPPDAHCNNYAGPAGNSALSPQSHPANNQPLTFRGIHCAAMSLFADLFIAKSSAHDRHTMPLWMYLAAISGWANPLVVIYLPFSFSQRVFKLRYILTLLILLCLGATVAVFATSPMLPLPGYFMWLLGIMLIVFPVAEML